METCQRDKRVYFAYSPQLKRLCDKFKLLEKRTSMAFALINACGLFPSTVCVDPVPASKEQMTMYHAEDYIDQLHDCASMEDAEISVVDELYAEYGLGYDCPLFKHVYNYAAIVTGATIQCADALVKRKANIAINITGGWHHASRPRANGHCYVNDCVLAVLKLREAYRRILYIDLDAHHGNGVEDAFMASNNIMTVSFHMYEPAFYPGTGSVESRGVGKGSNYAVNVPVLQGLSDDNFTWLFNAIMPTVFTHFEPDAVVAQLGVDGVSGDPVEAFNLTEKSYCAILKSLMATKLPLLLLGGGGYQPTNFAKCWAHFVATVVGKELPEDMPEHSSICKYGPDFVMGISASLLPNRNSSTYLQHVVDTILARY